MEKCSTTVDLDKLPINRLIAIDEAGNEQFSPDVDNEEKRLGLIRRIDFASVVEKDSKKHKKGTSKDAEDSAAKSAQTWPWQGLVENLRLAHQELSVVVDLIETVEANDAVSVAVMQKPKQLSNEVLSDLAVSAATKFQRLRQLGRYFRQSSKAMEQKISRETKFYSSLIRLQQNWKVKRQRLLATGPGNEGFMFDLIDNVSGWKLFPRPLSISTVRVDHDPAGYLITQRPSKSCHSLSIRFLGTEQGHRNSTVCKTNIHRSSRFARAADKESLIEDDVSEKVKETHSVLREIHQSIFFEQVFYMVNHEASNPSAGVNVTGICEGFLQLAIGQDISVCLCLEPSGNDDIAISNSSANTQSGEHELAHSDSFALATVDEKIDLPKLSSLRSLSPVCIEVFLLHIFHQSVIANSKDKRFNIGRPHITSETSGDSDCLLGHFCKTVAHRIFANKVLSRLECLVSKVPHLHLLSHPTWHPRTSVWTLSMRFLPSVLHLGKQSKQPEFSHSEYTMKKSKFQTKVVVKDDEISVSGEGVLDITGSVRENTAGLGSVNSYSCELDDLIMIILQQVAGQIIKWLHEEALMVGMNANRDFLCLFFDLDQGGTLGLVAHVDPYDTDGYISWWMVLDDGSMVEPNCSTENGEHASRRFLGYLSLESLYSMLMDLVSLCSSSRNH